MNDWGPTTSTTRNGGWKSKQQRRRQERKVLQQKMVRAQLDLADYEVELYPPRTLHDWWLQEEYPEKKRVVEGREVRTG